MVKEKRKEGGIISRGERDPRHSCKSDLGEKTVIIINGSSFTSHTQSLSYYPFPTVKVKNL